MSIVESLNQMILIKDEQESHWSNNDTRSLKKISSDNPSAHGYIRGYCQPILLDITRQTNIKALAYKPSDDHRRLQYQTILVFSTHQTNYSIREVFILNLFIMRMFYDIAWLISNLI